MAIQKARSLFQDPKEPVVKKVIKNRMDIPEDDADGAAIKKATRKTVSGAAKGPADLKDIANTKAAKSLQKKAPAKAAPKKAPAKKPVVKEVPPQKVSTRNSAGAAGARAPATTDTGTGAVRGRRSGIAGGMVTFLVKKPEDSGLRGGRLERFEALLAVGSGKRVEEYISKAGLTAGNIKVFQEKELISIK